MAGGLVALLDDIAALTRIAAASLDDIGLAATKAGTKAAGVVIDDAAVTPRYVVGLSPDRELPIIGKIALGSLKNKLLILLPVALALSVWAPFLITPLLMIGGAFLCYEAAHKIIGKLTGHDHTDAEMAGVTDPAELEQRQVSGAIRTDFILSAEIMAIALNTIDQPSLVMRAVVLAVVAIAITVGVYGAVALIVKMDDLGLRLARSPATAAVGRGLLWLMPRLLTALSVIGTAAMVWVGGGIILHGLEEFGLGWLPHLVHDGAHAVAGAFGSGGLAATVEWLMNALGAGIVGMIVGGIIVGALSLLPSRKAATAAH